MTNFNRKNHWENIFSTKKVDEVSWYQPTPITSLDFLKEFNLSKTAKIIDVGGGDSFLVDHLLNLGYTDVTVLDISTNAIDRAKKRLGEKADQVKWIVSDSSQFQPTEKYDFWHDRASLHFLTEEKDIGNYVNVVKNAINNDGYMVIGAFSEEGPLKCSGIAIKQYSGESLAILFEEDFEKIKCFTIDHQTPSDKIQNFTFCGFRKK